MKDIIRLAVSKKSNAAGVAETRRRAASGALAGGFLGGLVIYVLFSVINLTFTIQNGFLVVFAATLTATVMGSLVGTLAALRAGHAWSTVKVLGAK